MRRWPRPGAASSFAPGRFVSILSALAVVVTLLGCASTSTIDRAATEERFAPLRTALAAYDSAGFLVGPPVFPVVGRAFTLPGPGDTVYLGFAASMPPAALRFARDEDAVAARYQVVLRVRSGGDTLMRVERREVVRVKDFEEAASRAPRVVFQRLLKVPAGRLQLDVTVRELTSRSEGTRTFDVDARSGLSPPLLAYRAEPRTSRADTPAVLVSPRSVAYATQSPPPVLVEDAAGAATPLVLGVDHEGSPVWEDTLFAVPGSTDGGDAAAPGLVSVVTALPVHLLPPGRATLRVERPGEDSVAAAPMYIGLGPEWVFPTWETSVAHLEYALEADTLERWSAAPPAEHASLWRRFQERTDPDPATPENEFLRRYLGRMNDANDRFDEPGRAGWETDRGQVLVKLGEPDRQRFIPPERQGEVPRIEWEYDESVPTSALIAFEDTSDFGVYVMTPRSRAALRRVVAELAAAAAARRGVPVPDGTPQG